jgi:hypothetical protein
MTYTTDFKIGDVVSFKDKSICRIPKLEVVEISITQESTVYILVAPNSFLGLPIAAKAEELELAKEVQELLLEDIKAGHDTLETLLESVSEKYLGEREALKGLFKLMAANKVAIDETEVLKVRE